MNIESDHRKTKLYAALLCGTAVSLVLSGCASSDGPASNVSSTPTTQEAGGSFDQAIHDLLPEDIQSSGSVTVGITPEDPPFMAKVDGVYEGIIPDLMAEVSEIIGIEFKTSELPFPGLIPAIQANKINFAWTSMFDTAEREQVLDFVSYSGASAGLLVQKGNPKKINYLEDLCGTVAATTKGTVQAAMLEEQVAKCKADGEPELTLSFYDTQSAAHVQLQAGQVDSFFGTATPTRYLAAHAGDGKWFEMGEGVYPIGYLGVAATKSDPGFAQAMEAALIRMVEDGTYDEIFAAHDATDDAISVDEVVVNGRTSGELE